MTCVVWCCVLFCCVVLYCVVLYPMMCVVLCCVVLCCVVLYPMMCVVLCCIAYFNDLIILLYHIALVNGQCEEIACVTAEWRTEMLKLKLLQEVSQKNQEKFQR